MPAFTRFDMLFVALGAALGLTLTVLMKTGLVVLEDRGMAFLWIVIPLGIVEVSATYVRGEPPGSLITLHGRIAALAAGLLLHLGLMRLV